MSATLRQGATAQAGVLSVLLGVPVVVLAPLWVPLLRHAVGSLFAISGVGPDVAALAAVAAAWTRRPWVALTFAFLIGAQIDLLSATPWGWAPLRYVLLTVWITRLRPAVDADGPVIAVILCSGFVLIERCTAALSLGLYRGLPLEPLVTHAAWVSLYTAAFAPLAFAIAKRLPGEGP